MVAQPSLRAASAAVCRNLLLAVVLVIVAPIHVSSSPHSPHVARCSPIWQTRGRPCSWFEGWYVRVVDPSTGGSYAAIIGSMPVANRSIAMLLSCHPKGGKVNRHQEAVEGQESYSAGDGRRVMREGGRGEQEEQKQEQGVGDTEGERGEAFLGGASKEGACAMGAAGDGRSVEGGDFESLLGHGAAAGPPGAGACEETLIEKMEIAPPRITVGSHPARPVSSDPRDADPPVFEWRAEGHGFLISRGFNHTAVDIRVGGSRMQANLTNQPGIDCLLPFLKRIRGGGGGGDGVGARGEELGGALSCRPCVDAGHVV
ncbi:hypothetical protein CLOM_g19802 [Closterium sp. NIES-68]|nr:hypothetical protein CLOM_g19802 [Closterium sp. NIES-68]GJP80578.1 hypothetical protein CLOP_g10781 [Closterium sp. NIES-67]